VIVVSVALISHVVVQQATLKRALDYNLPTMQKFADRAQILRNTAGVHRPCLLYGPGAIQLSYLTGCAAHYTTAVPNTGDSVISAALADGDRVVVLLAGANTALPAPYARWQRVESAVQACDPLRRGFATRPVTQTHWRWYCCQSSCQQASPAMKAAKGRQPFRRVAKRPQTFMQMKPPYLSMQPPSSGRG
jgi:hypothetical protein